jgi:hypothetical protein
MTDNWNENSDKTTYKHKSNPNVVVLIRRNLHGNSPKYFVWHSHPASGGSAIMQEPEGALTMASARKKAEMHMRHWNVSNLWSKDIDYNRLGARGK